MHKVGLTNRHTQLANVESLNRQLGRLFNGYMNRKEVQTGKVYRNWTDVVGVIRKDLNKVRMRKLPKDWRTRTYPAFDVLQPTNNKRNGKLVFTKPKFNVNDQVYRMLDYPKNALNKKQYGTFRVGDYKYDDEVQIIKQIFYLPGRPNYRYSLVNIPNTSYTESQLKNA